MGGLHRQAVFPMQWESERMGKRMKKYVKNCGECPFYEWFFDEFDLSIGKKVGKGKCYKFDKDERYDIAAPCFYAEKATISELEKAAFGKGIC